MTVHVKTYSPFLDQWDTSPDNYYDIRLSPIVPGDFDYNGVVDGSDLLVWQRGLGSTTDLAADGNDDGVVDGDDLLIWKQRFGMRVSSLAATSQTPEPDSQLLALAAGAVTAWIGRRGRFAR